MVLLKSSLQYLSKRPRRNRVSEAIRGFCQETHLHASQLIAPLFLLEGEGRKENISSMPGVFRYTLDSLLQEIEELLKVGVNSINLYPVVPHEYKDSTGSFAIQDDQFYVIGIQKIKEMFPEICILSDIALDPYTSHGHDGVIDAKGHVLNDETVELLSQMAVVHAKAGVDIVAPSDMMDGRVQSIRFALDQENFYNVGITAYSAKYASALYAPFRNALHSAPRFGDKKMYQMNPANIREALLESALDIDEGADCLLIKPALPYLDVIAKVKENSNLPIMAFQVSGEYAMVAAAAQLGWVDGPKVLYECTLSIKRAGADAILTYGAKELALYLKTKF
ncbi:MAG: porphobilinogen synthase [Parachlamydiales bacterium]|nr:porphobilinogen synthase [Parachlamydiales bacterium]